MSENADFHEESQRVRLVARARDQSEYDVFVSAWEAWYGDAAPASQVDIDFDAYLREQGVPAYVRHFVRHWLKANPELRRRSAEDRRAVRRARLLALALITLAVVLALFLGREAEGAAGPTCAGGGPAAGTPGVGWWTLHPRPPGREIQRAGAPVEGHGRPPRPDAGATRGYPADGAISARNRRSLSSSERSP